MAWLSLLAGASGGGAQRHDGDPLGAARHLQPRALRRRRWLRYPRCVSCLAPGVLIGCIWLTGPGVEYVVVNQSNLWLLCPTYVPLRPINRVCARVPREISPHATFFRRYHIVQATNTFPTERGREGFPSLTIASCPTRNNSRPVILSTAPLLISVFEGFVSCLPPRLPSLATNCLPCQLYTCYLSSFFDEVHLRRRVELRGRPAGRPRQGPDLAQRRSSQEPVRGT